MRGGGPTGHVNTTATQVADRAPAFWTDKQHVSSLGAGRGSAVWTMVWTAQHQMSSFGAGRAAA